MLIYLFVSKSKDADYISKTMGQLDIGEPSSSFKRKPVIIIVVGMAGIRLCRKTTIYSLLPMYAFSLYSEVSKPNFYRKWKDYIPSPASLSHYDVGYSGLCYES